MSSSFINMQVIHVDNKTKKEFKIKKVESPLYIEIEHSNNTEDKIKKELLPLLMDEDKGRFDIQSIANNSGTEGKTMGQVSLMSGKGKYPGEWVSVQLKTPSGDFFLKVTPKGDIDIERIPKGFDIEIKTPFDVRIPNPNKRPKMPGKVIVEAPLECHMLSIKANRLLNERNLSTKQLYLALKSDSDNHGLVFSEDILRLNSEASFRNHRNALMATLGDFNIQKMARLINDGTLVSKDSFTTDSPIVLSNAEHARIISESILDLMLTGDSRNAGHIRGKKVIIMGEKLTNELTGRIIGEEKLTIELARLLQNAGGIISKELIKLILNDLQNGLKGFIHSNNTLEFKIQNLLENSGGILAKVKLLCEVRSLITHPTSVFLSGGSGKLTCTHEAITQGMVGAKQWLKLETPTLKNGLHGKIGGNRFVEIDASDWIKNFGVMTSDELCLQSKSILNRAASQTHHCGTLLAKNLKVKSDILQNGGDISGQLSAHIKDLFENLISGRILTNDHSFLASGACTNEGLIDSAKDIVFEIHSLLKNTGTIQTVQDLKVKAATLQHLQGLIASKKDIDLELTDWVLASTLKATHDFIAKVKKTWDWQETGSFKGEHKARLELDKGYCFTRPLHHTGSLEFQCKPEALFWNQTEIKSDHNLTLDGKVINGNEKGTSGKLLAKEEFSSTGPYFDNVNGLVYGGKKLVLDHDQGIRNGRSVLGEKTVPRMKNLPSSGSISHDYNPSWAASIGMGSIKTRWQHSNGAMLATGGDAILNSKQGGFWNDFGFLDINRDLNACLATDINNVAGKIRVGRHAEIQARHLYHQMLVEHHAANQRSSVYALTDRPIMIIGGNATFKTPITAFGGDIHSIGTMQCQGNKTHEYPVEEYDAWVWHRLGYLENKTDFCKRAKRGFKHAKKKRVAYDIFDSDKKTYAVNASNVSGQKQIQCDNPLADLYFGSSVQTQYLNLKFATCRIGNTLDSRYMPNQARFETDLKSLYRANALFQEMNSPQAMFDSTVPLDAPKPVDPIFVGFVVSAIPLYSTAIEMRLVEEALTEQLGRLYIDDSTTSLEGTYLTLRNNAVNFAKEYEVKTLSEELLTKADRAMLVYRIETFKGQNVQVGKLILPAFLHKPEGVYAKTANLTGQTLHHYGFMKIDELLHLKVDSFFLEQPTAKDTVKGFHKKKGIYDIEVDRALPGKGQIEAGKILGETQFYKQLGGSLKSAYGTDFTIQKDAIIEGLRTGELLQGRQDCTVMPNFEPAYLISGGNQSFVVTQGGFAACGLMSWAAGDNKVIGYNGISSIPKMEEFLLPVEKTGKGLSSKKSGGTSTASLGNQFHAGQKMIMSSENNIQLVNNKISSGDKMEMEGKKISIQEAIARETRWTKGRAMRGLTFQKIRIQQTRENALLSTLMVDDDVLMKGKQSIQIKGVKGLIRGSLKLDAPLVELSGAKESSKTAVSSHSFGMSFFGAASIEAMTRKSSARTALNHLLQEDSFFAAASQLARARDAVDIIPDVVKTFVEGWRLASMVAHSCHEVEGPGADLVGNLTDRWGLTTVDAQGERRFNPTFKFEFGKSKQRSHETNTVSTELKVLKDIIITGDIVRLIDGTELSAKRISIVAKQLLEINGTEDTLVSSEQSRGVQVSATVRDPDLVSVGASGGQCHTRMTSRRPAVLKADMIALESGDELKALCTRIEGLDLALRGQTITFNSAQDTLDRQGNQWNGCVGLSGNVSGGLASHQEIKRETIKSIAHARNSLVVQANNLRQLGSTLHSDNKAILERFDGDKERPVVQTAESLFNVHTKSSTQACGGFTPNDSIPGFGMIKERKERHESEVLPTFAAPNIQGTLSPNVNQSLDQQETNRVDKKTGFGIALPVVNTAKMYEDLKAIQTLPQAVMEKFEFKQPEPVLLPPEENLFKKMVEVTLLENLEDGLAERNIKVDDETLQQAVNSELAHYLSGTSEENKATLIKLGQEGQNSTSTEDAMNRGIQHLCIRAITKLASLEKNREHKIEQETLLQKSGLFEVIKRQNLRKLSDEEIRIAVSLSPILQGSPYEIENRLADLAISSQNKPMGTNTAIQEGLEMVLAGVAHMAAPSVAHAESLESTRYSYPTQLERMRELNRELAGFRRQQEIDRGAGLFDTITFGATSRMSDSIANKNSSSYTQGQIIGSVVDLISSEAILKAGFKIGKSIYQGFKSAEAAKVAHRLEQQGKLTDNIRSYLQKVEHVSWPQLVKDLESMGLKNKSSIPDFPNFIDSKRRTRAMIHHAESKTQYDHLHLFNNQGKSLNKELKVVKKDSPDAHIKIKQNTKTQGMEPLNPGGI